MEEEDNIILDGQNENEDVDNNSIDFSDEEIDDAASFEPSNSNHSNILELITERLKEKNDMKSTSLNDNDLGKSNSTSSLADYSDTNSEEDSPIELETLFDDKNSGHHPSFAKASDSEISRLQSKVDEAKHNVDVKKQDVHERQMQYNYHKDATTARHLSEAKNELAIAQRKLEDAKYKLNHAR